jgi:hypothetical protein
MSVLPGTRYRRFYDRAEQVLPKEMINASISSSGDASASKLDGVEGMGITFRRWGNEHSYYIIYTRISINCKRGDELD